MNNREEGGWNVPLKRKKALLLTLLGSVLLLAYLNNNNGTMPYNDKSNPDDIRDTFGMSKSAFKRALGKLMRERLVNQNKTGTFIVK